MLTKWEFEELAGILKKFKQNNDFRELVNDIADMCEQSNERFDRGKFIKVIFS